MNGKRKAKKVLGCLVAIVIFLSMVSIPLTVFAADPVSLTVSSVSGTAGSDVVVSLNISADSSLAAAGFFMQYDNTKLTYKSYTVGSAATSNGAGNNMSQINPTYSTNGNFTTINDSYIGDPGIIAGGSMMNVTFTIKTGWTGLTPLTLTVGDFYNTTWDELAYTVTNGSVSVTVPQSQITFDANGGTGGWGPTAMNIGDPLSAPEVTRPGYNFTGWDPAVPATVPATSTTYTAQWTAIPNPTSTITFDSTGGSTVASITQDEGTSVTAPADPTKAGFNFAGWQPVVPATMPVDNVTCVAQWTPAVVEFGVTVTKTESNMVVNIQGWEAAKQYQIWSYQQITSDYLIDAATNVPANQWILSKAYTLGSAGVLQGDNSINFTFPNFTSPDDNYTISVRVADGSGNFLQEIRDSYTPANVSEVVITKTLVDGSFSTGYEVKDISASEILIKVIGNGVSGTSYTATADGTSLTPSGTNLNEFIWAIDSMKSGIYSVEIGATNGSTSDSQTIQFELYDLSAGIDYGIIQNMDVTVNNGTVTITPTFANGSFWYRISEPGKTAFYTSGFYYSSGAIEHPVQLQPGTYQVTGYVNRTFVTSIGNAYDDFITKNIIVVRAADEEPTTGGGQTTTIGGEPTTGGGEPTTGGGQTTTEAPPVEEPLMTLTANTSLTGVATGTQINFIATAASDNSADMYSFWRSDARGTVLVKDWSSSNTLNWTPARVGNYTIEARAKGNDAGSYEEIVSVAVTVTDANYEIAQGVVITLNETELDGSQARMPILIKASATSTNSEKLLYKFNIGDQWTGTRTVQDYSANQYCTWTPRKAGTYTISVLVKNDDSFGTYDASQAFTVIVD